MDTAGLTFAAQEASCFSWLSFLWCQLRCGSSSPNILLQIQSLERPPGSCWHTPSQEETDSWTDTKLTTELRWWRHHVNQRIFSRYDWNYVWRLSTLFHFNMQEQARMWERSIYKKKYWLTRTRSKVKVSQIRLTSNQSHRYLYIVLSMDPQSSLCPFSIPGVHLSGGWSQKKEVKCHIIDHNQDNSNEGESWIPKPRLFWGRWPWMTSS